MADELIATFDQVDAKPEVGALVIRAVGKSFCAGGDIATLTAAGKDPAAPEAYEGMGKIYDSFYRLVQVNVPTVAAVRGLGRGCRHELAAGGRPAGGGARGPAAVRFPEARDAPRRRALRHPVAVGRPRGGGDGAVGREDQRKEGRRARSRSARASGVRPPTA